MTRITTWLLLAIVCLAALPATAAVSGLVLIPTADLLREGVYDLGVETYGTVPGHQTDTYILDTEVGLPYNLEAGADYDFSSGAPTRLLLNAKYRLPLPETLPVMAVGLYNVGKHVQATPYAVISQPIGEKLRGHLGVERFPGATEAFLGADYAINDRWVALADYTTGSGNYAAGGAVYQVTDNVWVLGALLAPNGGGETEFSLQIGLGGTCWRCSKK
jgi:hypothetical protein